MSVRLSTKCYASVVRHTAINIARLRVYCQAFTFCGVADMPFSYVILNKMRGIFRKFADTLAVVANFQATDELLVGRWGKREGCSAMERSV